MINIPPIQGSLLAFLPMHFFFCQAFGDVPALREPTKDANAVTNAHAALAIAVENTSILQSSELQLADDS